MFTQRPEMLAHIFQQLPTTLVDVYRDVNQNPDSSIGKKLLLNSYYSQRSKSNLK